MFNFPAMATDQIIPGFDVRPADFERDLPYALDLIQRLTKGFTDRLRGETPPQQGNQPDFFKRRFQNPNVRMILKDDRPVGFFSIVEEDRRIDLQMVYTEPSIHGHGIGRAVLQRGLDKAHELRKPLETEVLVTNEPVIGRFEKMGFRILRTDSYNWIKWYVVRHKDTDQYALDNSGPPAPRLAM
jgi:GNAT superfamily N-acetyltransferase